MTVGERRIAERHLVNLPNQIVVKDQRVDCRLIDISSSGALLETDQQAMVGSDVAVSLPGVGDMIGKVVRVSATHIALSFPGVLAIAPLLEQATHAA
jgi:PilZ domain